MGRRITSILIWTIGLVIPLILAFDAAGHESFRNFVTVSAGISAFSLMAVNFFLATRPPFIESWIGGLDRLYAHHKWIGISVFVLILYHANFEMKIDGKIASSQLAKLSVETAKLIYPVLITLLALSFIKRIPKLPFEIPYQFWRWSHRAIGVLYLGLLFHQFFVKAPFTNNAMVSSYLNILGLIGIACYLYTQLGAPFRKKSYVVTHVDRHVGATVISASPKGRPISTKPGNFAFLSVSKRGLGEPHPFTISGHALGGGIQFSIKGLGDFTRRIGAEIEVGDKLRLEGGYGKFNSQKGGAKQVWLAGGVGITPFLAWADALDSDDTRQIDLIYCVRAKEEAVSLERLKATEERVSGFRFHLYSSADSGRFSSQDLVNATRGSVSECSFWFCGPAPLRKSVLAGLKDAGQSPKSVHYELFEFR